MADAVHLLVLTAHTAKTGCGKTVVAHYPQSGQAMVVGESDNIKVTMEPSEVSGCHLCKRS
jgi:hypothetical protein